MTKRLVIFLSICSLPFLAMLVVNEVPNNPKQTDKYLKERCTRNCHNVGCQHWQSSYDRDPTSIKKFNKQVFDWYVYALHNNPLNMNYGAINLFVFFLIYPLFGGLLLWRILTHSIK